MYGVYRHSTLKETEHNSFLFKSGLLKVNSFPAVWHRKGTEVKFIVKNTDKYYLSQVVKVNINSDKSR